MSRTLHNDRFPRSNAYNPEWILESPMGAHPLWLTEWLTQYVRLEPGMRVLDLGCGKAKSSIFLAREFDVEVWAVDLWTGADELLSRVEDAGVSDLVIPIHADARQLPFAGEFFDAVVCIDSFNFFGTDDLYLNYLAHFIREGGTLAFASAGLATDFEAGLPPHLQGLWTGDYWTLHTSAWWRAHVAKTGLFDVSYAGDLPDGWRLWSEWAAATDSAPRYRNAVKADGGRYLAYVGLAAQRIGGKALAEHAWPSTLACGKSEYVPYPVLPPNPGESGRSGVAGLLRSLFRRAGR